MVQTSNKVLYYVGITVQLISTTIQNIGLNLMKQANINQQKVDSSAVKKSSTPQYWKNKKWWISTSIFLFGVIFDFIALSLIPSTVSLAVGSLGLIINCLMSHFMLKERINALDVFSVILNIGGSFCVVICSIKDMPLINAEELERIIHQKKCYWFLTGMLVFILITTIISHVVKNAFLWSLIPGEFSLFTVILGACCGQMILCTIRKDMQLDKPEFWVCVILLLVAILMLNQYLQRANTNFDNMIVVPVYFTSTLIMSVLSGLLFFSYFDTFNTIQIVVSALGIVMICTGCLLLLINHRKSEEKKADEMQNVKSGIIA